MPHLLAAGITDARLPILYLSGIDILRKGGGITPGATPNTGRKNNILLNKYGLNSDTIIPEPGSSQAYDRYAYVNGNPVNFNDPSGHRLTECGLDGQDCGEPGSSSGGGGGSSGGGSGGGGNGSGNSAGGGGGNNSELPFPPPMAPNNFSLNPIGLGIQGNTITNEFECTYLQPCLLHWEMPKWWGTNEKNPDYYTISLNFGEILAIGGSITLDRYGVVYLGGNISIGKDITALSGGYMVGYLGPIPNHELPDYLTLSDSLSGVGINATLGAVGAIGVNKSIDSRYSKRAAYEYGSVLPASAGISIGYQFIIYDPNRK